MADFTIYIGNKNYSSWSLRPWLALKASGLDFDEVVIPLYTPGYKAEILRYSPSGKVPVLHHGDRIIWDGLAIAEYLAELVPERLLWPAAPVARALARSVAAEMHSSFAALRAHCPMNIRSSFPNRGVTPDVQADINRITSIWRDCRKRYGEASVGPFLFGGFTIADAMFAPVVSRFRTYRIELDEVCQAYADAVWALPSYQEWQEASRHEPMIIEDAEF
ncbi:glutathione S-transferase [Aliidongia dinghuensis]|uniref:Glutathione S-transferase n=1 Tax=Aliidongia dinghuensis TaxID=1867774 RepID=A0A8J2YQV7_9PROT|nr:glutathione S-transferase family protein [Aliidongia dinghuensis]GGF08603.1 glutathione S-transferase [Aliidongia dinghuensis]